MSTFKELVKDGILSGKEKCNLRGELTPDGCWSIQNENLALGHLFCVEYQSAIEDLPRLIIDAFINKFGEKPDAIEFAEITKEVIENMKIAVDQSRV